MTNIDKSLLLLDDGTYYIERNPNGDPATTNGFLHRRTVGGVASSRDECIGSYQRNPSGTWGASINRFYDAETDSDSMNLGEFKTNIEAIIVLWKARHDAYLSL